MKQEALEELERIRSEDPDDMLRPEAVVEAAKKRNSPLHDYFTWDDDEAAKRYRLIQARQLIRVAVTVLPRSDKKTRAYVSLSKDRSNMGGIGGYRHLDEVLASAALRKELMFDAARELRAFRRKFNRLTEEMQLRRLFKVIDQAIEILEEEEEQDGEE